MLGRLKALKEREGAWACFALPGLLLNRVRIGLIRKALGVRDIYIVGTPRIIGRRGIVFGAGFTAGRNLWLEAVFTSDDEPGSVKLVIGDNLSVSESVHIAAIRQVRIGRNVLIGSQVLISDHDHGSYGGSAPSSPDQAPNARTVVSRGPVIIEDNVWIGDGVRILSGAHIAQGAVIGANTVVRGYVPAASVYASKSRADVIRQYDQAANSWVRKDLE